MTALAPRAAGLVSSGRPVGWRALAWVVWRQQRAILLAALGVIAAVALILLLSGLAMHHTAARLGPGWWIQTRSSGYYSWAVQLPLVLQMLPILIGAFVGAPLLAREAESGTFRFAWTQGAGRLRLLTAQLVPVVIVLATAVTGFGVLFDWWFGPLGSGVVMVRFQQSAVDLFAPSLAGWALVSLTFGVLAGTVIRRTVAAMGATMIAYVVLAYFTARHVRDHYLAPLIGPLSRWSHMPSSAPRVVPRTADVLTSFYAWPSGRHLTANQMSQSSNWFARNHIVLWGSYQPAGRFWAFQWIEAGWLAALSVLLVAATVVVVRRRAV